MKKTEEIEALSKIAIPDSPIDNIVYNSQIKVQREVWVAGYTACQEDQQKAWSESCKCTQDDRHGETWCCNHCGLPTSNKCQDEDRWVPVSERLPYKDGKSIIPCTVYCSYNGVISRPFNEHHQVWDDEDGDDTYSNAVNGRVTHWQLAPNPPKK